jgi:hypothetical protein
VPVYSVIASAHVINSSLALLAITYSMGETPAASRRRQDYLVPVESVEPKNSLFTER